MLTVVSAGCAGLPSSEAPGAVGCRNSGRQPPFPEAGRWPPCKGEVAGTAGRDPQAHPGEGSHQEGCLDRRRGRIWRSVKARTPHMSCGMTLVPSHLGGITCPLQHPLDPFRGSRHHTALVRVLHSQDKAALMLPGKQVVVQSRPQAPQVQEPCGTGGEGAAERIRPGFRSEALSQVSWRQIPSQ